MDFREIEFVTSRTDSERIEYWKRRALSAEFRLKLLKEELGHEEKEKKKEVDSGRQNQERGATSTVGDPSGGDHSPVGSEGKSARAGEIG
jgi:hypothetical protein